MTLSVKMLKEMVQSRSRKGNSLQEIIETDGKGDNIGFKGAQPITVLHVHGGPRLSRRDRLWFEKCVGDFVWDYKKR